MPETRSFLADLKKPIHLQVFVTPTCPYCPQAVILAHRMALESENVYADMVEATEFPELAERFQVSGVPQTTINMGAGSVVGAYPEPQLVDEIRAALAL
jgi:glutaredoxin